MQLSPYNSGNKKHKQTNKQTNKHEIHLHHTQ